MYSMNTALFLKGLAGMWLDKGWALYWHAIVSFAWATFNGLLPGPVNCLFVRYSGFTDVRRIGEDAERYGPWTGFSCTFARHIRGRGRFRVMGEFDSEDRFLEEL